MGDYFRDTRSTATVGAQSNLQLAEERQHWTAHTAQNGTTYFYNRKTNQSQWEKPKCLMTQDELINETDWKEVTASDNRIYYYNRKLNKSVWKEPEELRLIKLRLQSQQLQGEQDERKKEQTTTGEEQENEIEAQVFRLLLKEKKITSQTKWDQAQLLCGDDERWQRIKQISQRRRIYYEYIQDLKKKERQEQKKAQDKQREDFFKMLEESRLTSDTKFYKVSMQLMRDARFRALEEKLRDTYFQDFMDELYDREREEERKKRKEAQDYLRQRLLGLEQLSPDLEWQQACEIFDNDRVWKKMFDSDKITVFQEVIRDLQNKEDERINAQRKLVERRNRENFRDLLIEKIYSNELGHKTKYKNFVKLIQGDDRLLNLLGQNGSTPYELFQDQVELLCEYHSTLMTNLKRHLRQNNIRFEKDTSFQEFCEKLQQLENFASLEELLKRFFYNLFINKMKKQEKELSKKQRKTQKKFNKVLKALLRHRETAPASAEEVAQIAEAEIESNAALEKFKNIDKELKLTYIKEFLQKKQSSLRRTNGQPPQPVSSPEGSDEAPLRQQQDQVNHRQRHHHRQHPPESSGNNNNNTNRKRKASHDIANDLPRTSRKKKHRDSSSSSEEEEEDDEEEEEDEEDDEEEREDGQEDGEEGEDKKQNRQSYEQRHADRRRNYDNNNHHNNNNKKEDNTDQQIGRLRQKRTTEQPDEREEGEINEVAMEIEESRKRQPDLAQQQNQQQVSEVKSSSHNHKRHHSHTKQHSQNEFQQQDKKNNDLERNDTIARQKDSVEKTDATATTSRPVGSGENKNRSNNADDNKQHDKDKKKKKSKKDKKKKDKKKKKRKSSAAVSSSSRSTPEK